VTELHLVEADEEATSLVEEYLFEASMFASRQEWDQAIKKVKKALEIQPKYAEAYCALGEIHHAKNELENAQACYQHALALDPSFAKAHIKLAELHKQLGDTVRAATSLVNAIKVDPDSVCSHYYGKMIFGAVADSEECRNFHLQIQIAYQKAVVLNPSSAETHYSLGRVLVLRDSFEQALAEFEQAVALDPTFPQPYLAMGNVYFDLDQPKQALSAFQKAAGMEWPENSRHDYLSDSFDLTSAYLGLVKANLMLGHLDQAIAMTQLAVELHSPDTDPYVLLSDLAHIYADGGQGLLRKQEYDLAARSFQTAVGAYSASGYQLDISSRAYAFLGLTISFYRLGLVHLESGNPTEARHFYDKALEAWNAGRSDLGDPGREELDRWNNLRAAIKSAQRQTGR